MKKLPFLVLTSLFALSLSTGCIITGDDGDTDSVGDGDGDACGWGPFDGPDFENAYICGGDGEDPEGGFPMSCEEQVEELIEGGACGAITGVGCCDADGDTWFCGEGDLLVLEICGG